MNGSRCWLRPTRTWLVGALLAWLLLPQSFALAIGEQVGRIRGRITEPTTGEAMPGAIVTVRSRALIGGPVTATTGSDGRYEISSLPPGDYTIEVSYPGLVPTSRTLTVRSGETAPFNIAWTLEEGGAKSVSLTEKRAFTKPDSAQTGAVMEAETLRRIPSGRSYQAAATLVPGVAGGGNPNIRGGLDQQNRFLIDGLDITDPVTGTFSANLNFDAIGSVQVLTGGMEAQYNSLGGVINVITLSGSDEFHADVAMYANHHKLSAATGAFGSGLYNDRQPFNSSEAGPNQSYQLGVNVSGPILRNRLWYSATYELSLFESSSVKGPPLGAPPYNIQHAPETGQVHLLRLKLTWAPSSDHRLSLSANTDPGFFNNVSGDPNGRLGVAEDRQNQGGGFAIAQWDWFLSRNLTFNLQTGVQLNFIEYGPQGRLGSIDKTGCELFKGKDNCTWDPNRAQHINVVDETVWYQGSTYDMDRRWTVQMDPSLSLRGRWFGSHDVKTGVQMRYNYRSQHHEIPGGSTFIDNHPGGLGLEAGLCDPTSPGALGCFRRTDESPFDVDQKGYSLGFYLQDRWWTPLTWLTAVPGIRFDYGRTFNRNGTTVSSLFGVGPRMALVADVTRDGRNVISIAYGRSNEVLSLEAAANYDGNEAVVTTEREWDPTTRDFSRVLSTSGGPGGVVIDKKLTPPHADEITANLRRLVFTDTVAGIDYTWKRISNYWNAIEINQIWDPSGQRVVDWVDPGKRGQQVLLFTTPDDNFRTYHGVGAYLEGRPSPAWDFQASYTLSWLYGPGQGIFGSQFDNPRHYRYFDGFLPEDTRHLVKLMGAYQIGRLDVGLSVRYQTGNPVTKRYFNAQEGDYGRYRSPMGTETGEGNDIKQISELRTPDYLRADLRLSLDVFPERWAQQLTLVADVTNVLGMRRPTDISTGDNAFFGQVERRQSPTQVQLGLNYSY